MYWFLYPSACLHLWPKHEFFSIFSPQEFYRIDLKMSLVFLYWFKQYLIQTEICCIGIIQNACIQKSNESNGMRWILPIHQTGIWVHVLWWRSTDSYKCTWSIIPPASISSFFSECFERNKYIVNPLFGLSMEGTRDWDKLIYDMGWGWDSRMYQYFNIFPDLPLANNLYETLHLLEKYTSKHWTPVCFKNFVSCVDYIIFKILVPFKNLKIFTLFDQKWVWNIFRKVKNI